MHPIYPRLLCVILLNFILNTAVHATHFQGGEMSYTYLGSNKYRIAVRIYHDCRHGDAAASAQDLPMMYSIFSANGSRFLSDSMVGTFQSLPVAPLSGCYHDTNTYCTQYAELQKTVNLPPSAEGYIIVNQRCCMGEDVVNITDALNAGLTLSCTIPGIASGVPMNNSGPLFKSLPPARVCLNETFLVDFGAVDPEGDSLTYRLTTAYRGGSATNAKPTPNSIAFSPHLYTASHSPTAPLGPDGALTLDPATGVISGRCGKMGDYVISVACDEYRNGVLSSTITRTYVVPVTDCGKVVVARIEKDSTAIKAGLSGISIARCEGSKTVAFSNQSNGAAAYLWDFGVHGRSDDTSTAASPVFTYPSAGRYQIRLIAYGAGGCSDTLHTGVWLSDDVVTADFTISGGPCVLDTLVISDNSVSSGSAIVQNIWRIADMLYTGNPLVFPLTKTGPLYITHTAVSTNGCVASTERTYSVGRGAISGGNDTTVLVGETLWLQASGGSSYNWTPIPPAFAPYNIPGASSLQVWTANAGSNRMFILTGKDAQGCGGVDTVRVTIAERGYAFVPSAFSPNGDGRNDMLNVQLAGNSFQSFSVYNRRGALIFHSENRYDGWDGRYKNEAAPADVYFWMVRAKDGTGQGHTFKGDVMLLR